MAQFRVIPAFKWVVAVFTGEFRAGFHLCWPWLAILGMSLLAFLLAYPDLAAALAAPQDLTGAQVWRAGPALTAILVLFMVAHASTAVNWHHYLLLQDIPTGWMRLRLDWAVFRYLGNAFLIGLLISFVIFIGLVAGFAATLGMVLRSNVPVYAPFIAGAATALVPLIYRLSIKLPAVATEVVDYGFSNAMRDSEWNAFRILGYAFLVGFFGLVLGGLGTLPLILVALFGSGSAMTAAALLMQVAGLWMAMIFNLTAITLLYAVFAEGAEI